MKSEELLPPLLLGGNAGIAAAYSARKLGIPVTIVLPENTSAQVVRRLEGEGAEVQLAGKVRRKWKARAEWWGRGAVSSPTAPPPLILDKHWPELVFWSSVFSQEGGEKRGWVGQGHFEGWDLWTSCPIPRRPLSEGWRMCPPSSLTLGTGT